MWCCPWNSDYVEILLVYCMRKRNHTDVLLLFSSQPSVGETQMGTRDLRHTFVWFMDFCCAHRFPLNKREFFPPVVAIIKGSRAVGFSLKYCERAWPYYVKCPLKWHLLWFGIMQIRLHWVEWYGWKSGRKCEGREQLDLAGSSMLCIQACIWFCYSNVNQI